MSTFSQRLKQLRTEKSINQKTIADILGVSLQSYSTYENGREPNYDNLIKLAKYFGVSIDYLIGNSKYIQPENQSIHEKIGLSDGVIHLLEEDYKTPRKMYSIALNQLIPAENFESFILCLEVYVQGTAQKIVDQLNADLRKAGIDSHILRETMDDPLFKQTIREIETIIKAIRDDKENTQP